MQPKTTVALVLSGVTILALMGMMVYQSSLLTDYQQRDRQKNRTIESLHEDLTFEQDMSTRLEDEKQLLLDSIATLNVRILELEGRINELKNRVRQLEQRIAARNRQVDTLKKEIARLTQRGNADAQQIRELEAQKKQLQLEAEAMNDQQYQQMQDMASLEADRQHQVMQRENVQSLNELLNVTEVRWDRVLVRKREAGGELKKISKKEKKWHYTVLEFYLEHPQPRLLTGEKFLLTIVDLDTNQAMPFNQANPEYPNAPNESVGVPFTFDGNKVEILHYNQDLKTGRNYEARVSLLRDGALHRLTNGTYQLVYNGEVLMRK